MAEHLRAKAIDKTMTNGPAVEGQPVPVQMKAWAAFTNTKSSKWEITLEDLQIL